MSDITVIPFSWVNRAPWLPDADAAYEDDLRTCRNRGHELEAWFDHDGFEGLTCARCGAEFREERP
jgi:hypothetical protein